MCGGGRAGKLRGRGVDKIKTANATIFSEEKERERERGVLGRVFGGAAVAALDMMW